MTAAKYAGICKDCKKEYAIGVEIHRNTRQNWCRDGDKCSLKDLTAPTPPNEIEQQKKDNQQKKIDSQINDQTSEMTAKGIKKMLNPLWAEAFEDSCHILKGVKEGNEGFRETLILAEVFFKEYCRHQRELFSGFKPK
jgi:hypothetical protein